MGKIYCLMGKSSSGKDTILKILKEDNKLNLKPVIPYTTRPKRSNEENGRDYYFIDEETLKKFELAGKIIEKRKYNTARGIWYYCTIDDGQIDLSTGNYLLITTLEAYLNLKEYYGEKSTVPIYIEVDDGIRLERALKREKRQESPNYDELCRRFLADNKDFSDEKLKAAKIEKVYLNHSLHECVDSITKDILKMI